MPRECQMPSGRKYQRFYVKETGRWHKVSLNPDRTIVMKESDSQPRPPSSESSEEEIKYQVQKVLQKRGRQNGSQFLCKIRGQAKPIWLREDELDWTTIQEFERNR